MAVAICMLWLSAAVRRVAYVLVGHSYAVLVPSSFYARTYPKDVAGLVLVGRSQRRAPGCIDTGTMDDTAKGINVICAKTWRCIQLWNGSDPDRSFDSGSRRSATASMPLVVLSADRPWVSKSPPLIRHKRTKDNHRRFRYGH